MSKKRKQKKRSSTSQKRSIPRWGMILVPLAAVVLLIGGGLALIQGQPEDLEAGEAAAAVSESQLPIGHTAYCSRRPLFVADLGFPSENPGMATALNGFMGFVMFEPTDGSVYQHPTWDDAGFLGGSVRDGKGNIYIYPSPFGSTENNRPEDQNKLYKIDSQTGEMGEWIDLPPLAEPNESVNPYGITGLFLDCDTQSLFVASVMGSTAREEFGRIFQIDLETKEILSSYDNIDALGVGVHNGIDGKRLYFGVGRSSAILSIALDADGRFSGEPRREFFLAELEGGGNQKGQRISFPLINLAQEGNMVIKGVEFDYTLRAAGVAEVVTYEFNYTADGDWELVNVERFQQ